MSLQQARAEAKEQGVDIGKLTTYKDRQGEYTLKEDGHIVSEGYFESANDIKEDYINDQINNKAGGDWE